MPAVGDLIGDLSTLSCTKSKIGRLKSQLLLTCCNKCDDVKLNFSYDPLK